MLNFRERDRLTRKEHMFSSIGKRHIGGEGRASDTGIPRTSSRSRAHQTSSHRGFGSGRCGPGQCLSVNRPAPDCHPRLHARTGPESSDRSSRRRDAHAAPGQGTALPRTRPAVAEGVSDLRSLSSSIRHPGRSAAEWRDRLFPRNPSTSLKNTAHQSVGATLSGCPSRSRVCPQNPTRYAKWSECSLVHSLGVASPCEPLVSTWGTPRL